MLLTRIALSLHVLTCVALAGGCTSECDDSGMLQRLPGTALVEGAGIRPRFRGRGSGHLGRLKKLTRQRGRFTALCQRQWEVVHFSGSQWLC